MPVQYNIVLLMFLVFADSLIIRLLSDRHQVCRPVPVCRSSCPIWDSCRCQPHHCERGTQQKTFLHVICKPKGNHIYNFSHNHLKKYIIIIFHPVLLIQMPKFIFSSKKIFLLENDWLPLYGDFSNLLGNHYNTRANLSCILQSRSALEQPR